MTDLFAALSEGLPLLFLHFGAACALLAAGTALHLLLTPVRELQLARAGNAAAAATLATTTIALALPIATTLATSRTTADVLVWGAVGVVVQLVIYAVGGLLIGGLKERIERDEMAAAVALGGWQIGFGLLNAAALIG